VTRSGIAALHRDGQPARRLVPGDVADDGRRRLEQARRRLGQLLGQPVTGRRGGDELLHVGDDGGETALLDAGIARLEHPRHHQHDQREDDDPRPQTAHERAARRAERGGWPVGGRGL